jgi:hypothetical protein
MAKTQTAKADLERFLAKQPEPGGRKGARIGPVSELSVFVKVKPGREEAIRETFNLPPEQMAELLQGIKDVGTLHSARYVLFDDGTRLLVSTTFDGDWDVYIDDFAASYVLDAWDKFLIHTEGYPDEGKATMTVEEVKDFLHANQVTAANFYMDYPGVTTTEVKEALRVQAAVQESLDNPEAGEALQHPALKPLREVAAD